MSYGFFIITSYLVTFGVLVCLIGVSWRAYREEKIAILLIKRNELIRLPLRMLVKMIKPRQNFLRLLPLLIFIGLIVIFAIGLQKGIPPNCQAFCKTGLCQISN